MKKKIILVIFAAIILLVFLGGIIIYNKIQNDLESLSQLQIEEIDFSLIDDGEYWGDYSAFPVSAKVKVTIFNHEITEILILEHSNGQGGDAENITSSVIASQSLQVEVIAGATYSSKVILKAIENALS